jgi:pilus assembly protein CpaC
VTTRFRVRLVAVGLLLLTASSGAGRAQQQTAPAFERVALTVGRSSVLTTDFDVTRLAVTNPAVADATVVEPREILIDGKGPGTVSLILWGGGTRRQYDIVVEPGVSVLQQQLQQLFPGEDIQVSFSDDAIVLSGRVSSNAVMLRAGEIAQATASKLTVINMLQLPGGMESQQVMLQVRFAEVNRRVITELGASLFTGGAGFHNTWGRTSTQQFAAPDFERMDYTKSNGDVTSQGGELNFSDFLNLFFLNAKYDIGAVIRALKTSGQFQSLAEPNLIAYNGQEASFLAGGEFPIPIVQGATGHGDGRLQGVRHPSHLHADDRRGRDPPEGAARGQHARLRQRHHAERLPDPGAHDAARRDRRRAARRAVVRHRGPARQRLAGRAGGRPGARQPADHRRLFRSKANRAEQTELMVLITPRLVRRSIRTRCRRCRRCPAGS